MKEATSSDDELSTLREQVIIGWPETAKQAPKCIRSYFCMKDFISVEDGVLFFGERLLVPASMKKEYLLRIHEGHLGITKSQLRARECLYWKNMNQQIEEHIGDCAECLINSRSNVKEPMMAHETPSAPWQVISSDLFELDGQSYLLVADHYSKMPFVKCLGKDTRTSKVINYL